jgi:alpha-1,6-mannosyltransferase
VQPDLIEAGDAGHCAWAALRTKRELGIPAVAFYHSDLPRLMEHRFGELAMRGSRHYLARLYRQFDLVLAPSRLMVQQLGEMGIAGAIHQPLGIDVGVFRPQRRIETLRQHLQLAPGARLLVYAGRFTAEKKLALLIEAVRKLGRPYHLVLVGGGAALPRYPQLTYIPFKRDQRVLARLLASCDVMVHPGDCETFGLVVLEAMACGLPVVATGVGVAELVDEQTGWWCNPTAWTTWPKASTHCFAGPRGAGRQRGARRRALRRDLIMRLLNRYAGLLASGQRAE